MYQLTSNKNVNTDYLLSQLMQLKNISSRKKTKTLLSMKINEFIWNKFLDLKEQCGIIKFLVNLITPSKILEQLVTPSLPNHIVNIPRHHIIFSLSNGTNLQRQKQKKASNCIICQNNKTQLQSGDMTLSSLSCKQISKPHHNCFS